MEAMIDKSEGHKKCEMKKRGKKHCNVCTSLIIFRLAPTPESQRDHQKLQYLVVLIFKYFRNQFK